MVRIDWRNAFASMGPLSKGESVKVNVPLIDTDLRRDLEDSRYKIEKSGSEDIEELLEDMGL